ncbi:hypothetical protein STENM327S_07820 [Streptomyces tendae]
MSSATATMSPLVHSGPTSPAAVPRVVAATRGPTAAPVLRAAVAYEPAMVELPEGRLVEDPSDQCAAQRERQRAQHEHESEQGHRLVGQHGQGRPAEEQQRATGCDDQAGALVGKPPGDGDADEGTGAEEHQYDGDPRLTPVRRCR